MEALAGRRPDRSGLNGPSVTGGCRKAEGASTASDPRSTTRSWPSTVGTVVMKVQLIVVQGKPEGKVIPLAGPIFKIGRGETCHLRPNSEQVSREHAEFAITGDNVSVRDLGSRNGTLVNGKALTEACSLKDRDLVQVGPLTFAVSIQGAPAAAVKPTAPVQAAKPAAPDDVNTDDI